MDFRRTSKESGHFCSTKHASCRGCEALPCLLCCGALLSQPPWDAPPWLLSSSEGPREDQMKWTSSYCNSSISSACWSIITESASCWWYQWSQLTPPLPWSIAMNMLIHCLDRRADVMLIFLVFFRPSLHLYSKPETSFQKSNTQSPNTNYKYISSCLKFIKKCSHKQIYFQSFYPDFCIELAKTLCNSSIFISYICLLCAFMTMMKLVNKYIVPS